MDRYSIGEISKLFGISKQALRHYDKINLIKPEYTNPKTGYRYYEYGQFTKLGLIRSLKQTGMSLELIRKYIGIKDITLLKELLLEQEVELNNQLESIQNMRKFTTDLYNSISIMEEFKSNMGVEFYGVKTIERREVIKFDIDFEISQLYECIKLINQFIMISHKVHGSFIKNHTFLSINRDNIKNGNFGTYNSIGSFFIIDDPKDLTNLFTIESNLFSYTYHLGPYEKISTTYEKLNNYIIENNYEVIGDSIEIGRINILHTENPKDFITEIQIPVKKTDIAAE